MPYLLVMGSWRLCGSVGSLGDERWTVIVIQTACGVVEGHSWQLTEAGEEWGVGTVGRIETWVLVVMLN